VVLDAMVAAGIEERTIGARTPSTNVTRADLHGVWATSWALTIAHAYAYDWIPSGVGVRSCDETAATIATIAPIAPERISHVDVRIA
jgi:hypothetical protein